MDIEAIRQLERDLVFEYSEWLDADKNLLTPAEGDEQTHQDLVNEFFASRQEGE